MSEDCVAPWRSDHHPDCDPHLCIVRARGEIARLTGMLYADVVTAKAFEARCRKAEKARDEARAEVERLHPALRLHVEQLQELLGASREEVRRLTHAARLVIKEHSCGDIDACSVCGPLESALAGKGEP